MLPGSSSTNSRQALVLPAPNVPLTQTITNVPCFSTSPGAVRTGRRPRQPNQRHPRWYPRRAVPHTSTSARLMAVPGSV